MVQSENQKSDVNDRRHQIGTVLWLGAIAKRIMTLRWLMGSKRSLSKWTVVAIALFGVRVVDAADHSELARAPVR